ncbi:MAG: hypothetical protein Q3963_00900 [Coriobacteriaceae bacterium]|nr:hypothetical protein [Coriobacteriaceae bacterium]
MAKKKKKKMTASQAASARWTESEDYIEDDFQMESEARFWWRKMGRRGHIGLIGTIIIITLGVWVMLGMPGVILFPLFG